MRLYERDMQEVEVKEREEICDDEGIVREGAGENGRIIKMNVQPYKNMVNKFSEVIIKEYGKDVKVCKIGYTKDRDVREGNFIKIGEEIYKVIGKGERKSYCSIILKRVQR